MHGRKIRIKTVIILITILLLCSCGKKEEDKEISKQEETVEEPIENKPEETVVPEETPEESVSLGVEVIDEGDIIFYSSDGYYRYGPSIMKYEDGSMDAWFSAPGNSGSQWDWITYRHSDDGVNWSEEEVVLRPTPGSEDQCSVCDPGLIYFDGYYYMGYTSTSDYGHKGANNSAFVARSEYPDGPFEKWNGSGWGGDPMPIIRYENDPEGWGIGEISFVINNDDLFIYYTYYDVNGGCVNLNKADLVENWPLTMREKGTVLSRDTQDSLDVVYCEDLDLYLGFSIDRRMNVDSRLIMYESKNGKQFIKSDSTKKYIEDYAHNMGIAKSKEGHIVTSEPVLIGYAYGEDWGRWNAKFQYVNIYH